jgi:MoxR-like ATPase
MSAHPGAEDSVRALVPDVDTLARRLDAVDYLADEGLATALFFALRLPQPLLLEGEAGVGKTEAAKALAAVLETPLIRLQCYEGIDAAEALYEWNYPRQLLRIRLAEAAGERLDESRLFSADYLIARPLLQAIQHPGPVPAVLLIDELDRADDDFEAFLLELLAEAAITIPELGTVRAVHPPVVVLTSNRTRDLHDALKRRCLYHWIDYPEPLREVEIVRRRVPDAARELSVDVVDALRRLRASEVQKPPGIAEAIDWVAALRLLGVERLDALSADRTLGSVLRTRTWCARGGWAPWLAADDHRPAGVFQRVRPGHPRCGVAGDAGALGPVRAGAVAGAAGLAPGAVLDRADRVRVWTGPDRDVRPGVLGRVRRAGGSRCGRARGPERATAG